MTLAAEALQQRASAEIMAAALLAGEATISYFARTGVTMGATLDALHALQEIERRMAAIHGKANEKRRQIRVHQRAIAKKEVVIEEKQRAIQASQMEIDRIDLDVRTKDVELAKHRDALGAARTNKEYAAILTAINTEKADNTKQESRQLELMASLDTLRAECEEIVTERDAVAERKAAAESALQAYVDESADEVSRLENQRDEASKGVPPTVVATFQRIADRHDAEAMAEVLVLSVKRGEYACGGCNMAMTLQQVIGCKERDDIVLCASCGRILYLGVDGAF